MPKHHSPEQIIGILREAEAAPVEADVLKKHNIAKTTLIRWKQKYGGLDVSEARRLKELERENARLKRVLAEEMLVRVALKEELEKRGWA